MQDLFCARFTAPTLRFTCAQLVDRKRPPSESPGVDMKTLTEFSGTLIRMAARAEAEARKAIPKELLRVAPAPAPAEGVTAKPNENASPVPDATPADSPTDAAGLALAEQAAGGAAAVAGTPPEEVRAEKPGEAGPRPRDPQPRARGEGERGAAPPHPAPPGPGHR